MKKILFAAFLLLPVLTVSAQQNLSYAYDSAGNRISRTITVNAYNPSEDAPAASSRFYTETVGGGRLTLHTGSGELRLTIAVADYDLPLTGSYTLSDRDGVLVAGENLLPGNTPVEMESLPSGSYMLRILLNGYPSEWELVKL